MKALPVVTFVCVEGIGEAVGGNALRELQQETRVGICESAALVPLPVPVSAEVP